MPWFGLAIAILIIVFALTKRSDRRKSQLKILLMAAVAVFLTVSMVIFPEDSFKAAITGLDIWWNIVFPALLPFFIISQILIGLGVVHMMGIFLEPVMRPVFNVPGVGSFVMAMGLASGFPLGAVLTTDLRKQELINKSEAERLVSFTNTADPLFMFGAVAVGMIGHPEVGIAIAAAHYLSSLSVGIAMRFYKRNDPITPEPAAYRGNIFLRSLKAMFEARKRDNRPLGMLMGDAVRKSVDTLLLIGGFIIFFSVAIKVLDILGVVKTLSGIISLVLVPAGLDPGLAPSLVSGLFELDLGCQLASSSTAPLRDIVLISGVIIAWSGLSVHAQVASIASDTDINITPYILARLLHSILAGVYTVFLFPVMIRMTSVPVFFQITPSGALSFWWQRTAITMNLALIFLVILLVTAALIHVLRGLHFIYISRQRIR